jgi:3-oxoacyl-[acyl-carrier-protein] synthase II
VSLARSLLAANELDLVIAGGYDPISEYSYAGFNSMRLVSPTTVRPFAAGRDGMKVAEGYAVVVLEREGAATSRGARTLARLMGIGESCDSFHLSKPHPEGAGAAAAIERAIADAGVDAEAVDLIIAHGTATLDNDAAEYAALKQVFGDRLAQIAMLATKSHLGHSLGAAGAVDLIVAALALRDGVVPPCANLAAEAPLVGALALTRGAAREVPIQHVLTTSLGFGGANVAAILAPPVRPPTRTQRNGPGLHSRACADQRVAISGVGVVVPGGAGNNAFLQLLKTQGSDVQTRSSTVMQEELEPLVSARRTRRMSEFAKLAVAATAEALREAGIDDPTLFCEEAAAILATMHGPTAFCESFYRQIIKEGPAAANPSLFAEGVPNVASAHLSTSFGIKGFCQTLIGSRITGLDALSLAAARIRSGEWKRAIVGAAEEHTPLVQQVYERLIPPAPGAGKLRASSCAVTLLLESEECLAARSGLPHAFVDGVVARHFPVEHPARIRRSLRHAAKYVRGADAHVCTMNGTWIDRLERMVLPADRRTAASSPYRIAGEAFAAAPLLGLAAMLLRQNAVANEAPTIWPGWQIRDGASVGIICADYFGAVSVARLSLP